MCRTGRWFVGFQEEERVRAKAWRRDRMGHVSVSDRLIDRM